MTNQTYGRGQIENALWRTFAPFDKNIKNLSDEGGSAFRTRIRRLLEIDRTGGFEAADGATIAEYAFAPAPETEGGALAFETRDVFRLAVALEFLALGFKQREAVELVYYLRGDLDALLKRSFFSYEIEPDNPLLPDRYPRLPKVVVGDIVYRDPRIYLLVKSAELEEIDFEFKGKTAKKKRAPVFMMVDGLPALQETIGRLSLRTFRSMTVVELAYLAQRVTSTLQNSQPIRRGRKKAVAT